MTGATQRLRLPLGRHYTVVLYHDASDRLACRCGECEPGQDATCDDCGRLVPSCMAGSGTVAVCEPCAIADDVVSRLFDTMDMVRWCGPRIVRPLLQNLLER